ncbi:hypothetical protein M446_0575 [Methylobacterium sp. 4-46]|uniref:hypothetical protein n=1 Tax=unclassified Methylobacterium TaxID=2615210 RepID=UPI000152D9D7|nr:MULTISPECIES: hypothetical protein [Methylobacterium]ACA15137.1 hypothetical protein M446_0575 [Methylobacterium sp. 4-46]WFT80870.1 hypothetical protein QA634_02915 [Methylobacterium nodulans]
MRVELRRLLNLLDHVGDWISLSELDGDPYLLPDDDLFVPGLVARGWVTHDRVTGSIRINAAGRAAFERLEL